MPDLPQTPDEAESLPIYLAALLGLVVLALFTAPLIGGLSGGYTPAAWQETLAAYFISIVLEALPFILLGAALTALLEIWLPPETLPRITARLGFWGVPVVALLSPVFPVCECGVVMVVRGLVRKGLPLPHAITYLLAAPVINGAVLASTAMAFQDWRFVVARAVGGFLVAVAVGWAFWGQKAAQGLRPLAGPLGKGPGLELPMADAGISCGHDHAPGEPAWRRVAGHLADDFLEMMPYFLAGVLLASLIKALVAPDFIEGLAQGPVSGPASMMGLAFVLSLCSEADAFVAASFGQFGFASVLAFLVLGPMCDLKLLLAYRLIFTTRLVLKLVPLVWLAVGAYVALLELVS